MTDDLQRAPRKSIFLSAMIEAGALKAEVRIRNMSESGAMIEGAALPMIGTSLVLRRAEIEIGGSVIWLLSGRCGVRFEGVAYVDDWIAGRRLAGNGSTAGQRRVDAIQSAIRLGQPTDIFDTTEALATPAEPAGSQGLHGRIGDEVAAVQRQLDEVADILSDDPLMLARHTNQLQSIQAASEILEHLAVVLQAADPTGVADTIALQALRARLLKRSMF